MESISHKPKRRPRKIEEMTKEQIRQAILKKRECNTKAQQIVESLLETGVTDKYLLQCLPDINQSHLEDIVEERSIIHMCGYPICQKSLSVKDIPKQKYRISLKTNKVYDITARKNFCSNKCYNAAMFIKKQMLTSPLWFREYEDLPKFQLLEDSVGCLGEEVDVTLVERVKVADKTIFTSVNDFAQASLVDVPDNALDGNEHLITEELNENKTRNKSNDTQINDIVENVHNINLNNDLNESTLVKDNETEITTKSGRPSKVVTETPSKTPKPNPLNIVGEIIEKPEHKIDPILTDGQKTAIERDSKENKKTKSNHKKLPLVTALTIEVEKSLAEWFTLDTMLYLFGADKFKEMVADKGECLKKYLNNYGKGIFFSSNAYDHYQTLCKKLNILELKDRKYDNEILKRETKPLPNYSILQEESMNMQLKVKAFLSGDTEVPQPITDLSSAVPIDQEENTTNLPLVDKNSQNALRRRIVCQHLNKVLPDLLQSLGLLSLQISADVHLLVNTFKLKPNNIMFKPMQWTLIAIIFIKLLSLKNEVLLHLLGQQTAYQHMQLLLLSFKQDGGYLDRLISWLTDIDRLLDKNDNQFTLE